MRRIIAIVSGKGGTGKTVASVNLGMALHNFGEKVTIMDADITASNLGTHLGFYSLTTKVQDALEGDAAIKSCVYEHHSGLKVMPASIDMESVSRGDLSNLKRVAQSLDGTVIIDAPPGLGKDTIHVMDAADELLVVTNPDIPSVTNAVKAVRLAKEMKTPVIGLVVNKRKKGKHELTNNEIELMCDMHIVAEVPHDRKVTHSIASKTPVIEHAPYSRASIEFKKLAAALLGKHYKEPRFLSIKRFIHN